MYKAEKMVQSVAVGLACFLMLLSWWLPSHFRPWATAYQELLAALALVLTGFAVLFQKKSRISKEFLLIAAIAFIPAAQFLSGVLTYAGDAWVSACYILAFALALFSGYNLQKGSALRAEGSFAEVLAWTLLIGSLGSCVLAVMQWLGFSSFKWISPIQNPARPFANVAQPNNLATLLGMGLMSLLFLFERRKVIRLAAVLLALLLLFSIALTQSRTPWLTALFISGFWCWQQRGLVLRVTNQQMLLWVLIYTAMVVSVPLLTEYLGIGSGSLVDRVQQAARWSMYKQFIHAVIQGPWYGYGWGQVFVAQAAIPLEHTHYEPTFYTHNVLLDLLVWNGPLIGGLIIIFTVLWFWRLLIRANSLTAAYAWMALGCFVIHSMLEYPHAYLFMLIPAGLLLGVLQASVPASGGQVALKPFAVGAIVLCAATVTLMMWRDYYWVELEHQRAVLESNEEFVEKAEQDVSKVYLLTQMREYIYFIRLPIRTGYSEEQLQELLAVTERYPHFYFLLKSAYILSLNGRVDKAYELLMVLQGLHQTSRLEQALSYLLGKAEEHPELLKLLVEFGVQPTGAPPASSEVSD